MLLICFFVVVEISAIVLFIVTVVRELSLCNIVCNAINVQCPMIRNPGKVSTKPCSL